MIYKFRIRLTSVCFLFCVFSCFAAWDVNAAESIAKKTEGMKKYPGYYNYYWDEKEGKIWLEIDNDEKEFIYFNGLQAGVGSNDIGLDRGRLGRDTKIVKFHRVGPKVLLTQMNYGFVAISENPQERKAVEDAFAKSVLWGFEIGAETGEKYLIDLTAFLLSDEYNIVQTLNDRKQGKYKIDPSRSAIYLPNTKNFPKNSDFESILTYVGEPEGKYIKQVAPTPSAVTVRVHFSFLELPDDGYEPLPYDPRSSFNSVEFYDYATPISEPLVKRYTTRHRLQKKDPSAALSEAVEPIVYYLDPGTPEPVRSALLDGAKWWNQAYEAAGYKDAFIVEMLPDNADPLDIRYNVIQWVHRSTRGWSYGASISDPRTGEIIKGKVTLGSLRVRQDFLIATGLLSPYEEGKQVTDEMKKMALARLRQLSAHEVGHTIGLAHNHLAHMNERSSVMDYPHPLSTLGADGKIDLSKAYATDIGSWDKVAIAWGYSDFPEEVDDAKMRMDILQDAWSKGLMYLSTQDARPMGTAHPYAHQWINGKDPVEELYRLMKVREAALSNFSEKAIRVGDPMSSLEEVLVPLYLSHRYQVHAVYKIIGGLSYNYALRGDGQTITEMVPAEMQNKALDALMYTLDPKVLAIPERIVSLIAPVPNGIGSGEVFSRKTGITFDPLAAAESAAKLTLAGIFYPDRVSRVVAYHSMDETLPGLDKILDKLISSTWKNARNKDGYEAEIQRIVDNLVLSHMLAMISNENLPSQARSLSYFKSMELSDWLKAKMASEKNIDQKAHFAYAIAKINKYDDLPAVHDGLLDDAPPGAPIGTPGHEMFDFGCDN